MILQTLPKVNLLSSITILLGTIFKSYNFASYIFLARVDRF